jgi:hypothetical protein
MSVTSESDMLRSNLLRRLGVIEARLEAVSRRARELIQETAAGEQSEEDPVRRLEVIASNLEALEERLKKVEADMLDKESLPHTFGSPNHFSTGQHYPGLG